MKKRLATVASVLAGLASLGLGHFYFQRLEAEVSGGPKVRVLVTSKDVPVGVSLEEPLLAARDIPSAYVGKRHILASDLKKVLGARVTGGLRANDMVLWSDLAQFSDQSRVLSGLVQQGMRAVTIDGNDVDFGGLLRPGDRVDVLLTAVKGTASGSTRTLLQNLLVLSVGDNISRPDEKAERIRNRGTVTVSATVEGAQVLAQARKVGQLSLSLRNVEDITMVEGLPETSNESLQRDQPVPPSVLVGRASGREKIDHVR